MQDKYFSNIDLDLSKALFIFSYNDVELIDKILLDRIHRIKFDTLTLDDKLIIVKDYLLPELYTKFKLNDVLENYYKNIDQNKVILYKNITIDKLKDLGISCKNTILHTGIEWCIKTY